MTHLAEDAQFFVVLGVGGSLAALVICRAKYAEDWLNLWLILTMGLGFLSLLVIGVNEHEAIYNWWWGAPIIASVCLASSVAMGLTTWLRRKQRQPSFLNLTLPVTEPSRDRRNTSSWLLALWAVLNLCLFVYSFVR
jgi:hypothetical protein